MKRYIVPLLMLCLVALTASAQKSKDHNFEVGKHLDIFNQVYKNLELLYVDTLNPKETIGTGIASIRNSTVSWLMSLTPICRLLRLD